MPTLIEIKSLENCAALCRELGLSFIELSMDMPDYQEDKLDVFQLQENAEKYGVYYTIHLEGFLDPCAFNKRAATAYTETVIRMIEIAKQLKIPLLNMHLNRGDHFTLPDRKVALYDEYSMEYTQKLIVFRNACEKAIGNTDIKICVENCGDYKDNPYLRKGLALLLESPLFAQTFDVGHNASAGYTDEPTIMKHITKLRHIHLHDASGRNNHMILGSGDVDLKKYLNLAEYHDCRVVLEVKTVEGLRQSVSWLKANG